MNISTESHTLKTEQSTEIQRYWVGGLVALCAIAYLPAWLAFFVKDDIALITSARLDPIAALSHSWPGGFFRPAAELFFAAQHSIFGLHPLPYHLVSFAAHLGTVYFAYRLFNLLSPFRSISFVAATLFALHPLNTETVSWISGQMSLFSSLCTLVTLYLLSTARRLAALIPVFILGLGFYENFLLALLLWGAICWFDDRFRSAFRPASLWSLGCCSVAYLYWRFETLDLGGGYYQATLSLKTGLVNIAYYLYLLAGGSAIGGRIIRYRPEEIGSHFFDVFTPLLILNTLLLLACLYQLLQNRVQLNLNSLLPALWLALALLPAFLFPERPRRLSYLAVPGFALAMGQILCYLKEKTRPGPLVARTGIAIYVLFYASTLHLRNYDWNTTGALEHSIPQVAVADCRELIFDVPNLVGDALFFNSISTATWMGLSAPGSNSTVYAPFELEHHQRQVSADCYYRYIDGFIRPVMETDPRPTFSRGRNWVYTR
jgi:hypothetical protein